MSEGEQQTLIRDLVTAMRSLTRLSTEMRDPRQRTLAGDRIDAALDRLNQTPVVMDAFLAETKHQSRVAAAAARRATTVESLDAPTTLEQLVEQVERLLDQIERVAPERRRSRKR